jgi:hypothetical protein
MGFVVYSKRDGEFLRYYDTESKARAQVTGHNRKAIFQALRGNEYVKEWDLCAWADYEPRYMRLTILLTKWHCLNRSSGTDELYHYQAGSAACLARSFSIHD